MSHDPGADEKDTASRSEIPREEWPAWCVSATEKQAGRELKLHFLDDALGEVRLAEGQTFQAIEHDELGSAVAFTIRYGTGLLPMSYVIAEPRGVTQQRNEAGVVEQVTIVDSTNRRTFISLV